MNMFKNKSKLYIVIFLFAVLSISIGYAYLTNRLNINGRTAIKDNTWSVSFANIVQRECNVKTDNPVAIIEDSNSQSISFSVLFKKANDRYDFLVDVVNNGTIDAMIDSFSITGNEDIDERLNYSVTYLDGETIPSRCDSLYANSKTTLMVSISLSEEEMYKFKDEVSYNLSLNINYVQLDDKSCEINVVTDKKDFDIDAYIGNTACDSSDFFKHYNLIIKPNGGTYDGSTEDVVIKLLENQTYKIKTPILEGNRNHWTTDHEDNFDRRTSTIVMGNEDIIVTANWSDVSNYVARINDVYYETIQAAFDDAVTDDKVVLLKDTSESPINNHLGAIAFDMHGYSVSGTLTNSRGANLTLLNEYGSEEGEEGTKPSYYRNLDGIGAVNLGTLTLGVDNEDEEPLVDEGNIVALLGSDQNGGIGIKNSGTFNFYDGYLEGYIGLSGVFNKAPRGYYVFVDHNTERNCQKVYLIPNDGRAIAKSTFPSGVVMLYWDLQDALNQSMDFYDLIEVTGTAVNWKNEIGDAKIIQIIRDGWEASYPLQVYENRTASLDAAGFPIPTGNTITNNGDLYIINTVPSKGGMENSKSILNNGTLHLDGIIVNQTTDANTIENNGDLDVNKSTIRAISGYAIKVNSGTELIMDSDTLLAADKHALYNATSTNFTVQGGTIEAIRNDGKLTVKQGTNIKKLTSDTITYGILNSSSSSELTLDNLTLSVIGNEKYTYAVYNENNNAKVNIVDGNIEVTSRKAGGALESGEGATLVYGGNVTVSGNPTLKAINPTGTARIIFGANSIVVNGGDWEASGLNTTVFAGTGVTFNGGIIKSTGTNSKYIVYNYDTSNKNVTVNDDAIINTEGTCFVMRGGSVNVNSGEITCGGDFLFGSTWSNAYYSNHRSFGTANINGATINAGGYGIIGTGTVNMGGGTINSVNTGLYFTGDTTSSLSMNDGTITSSTGDGIYSANSNNRFSFGSVESDDLSKPYIEGNNNGVYMEQGGVTIKSGNIIGHNGYGVYTNASSVIGVDDRNVSVTIPMIKGSTYGLYIGENVPIEMYDGILKGETHGYYGVINGVADGYQLKEDGEENIDETLFNTCYLVEQDSFLQLKSTGVKYNSLQDAIDAVEDSDTIIVLKDHPVRSESSIPSSKNIIIDFQGNVLTFTKGLTNDGTVTMKDTVSGDIGGILSLVTRPIINKGTLTFDNGHYSTTTGMIVDNFGLTTINNGTFNVDSSSNYSYVICNEADSEFEMNDGLMDVNGTGEHTYGVYNYSSYYHPVNVTINGGTIDVFGSGAYNHGIVNESAQTKLLINNITINVESTYTGRLDLANTYGANGIYGGTVTFENGTITVKDEQGVARGVLASNFTLNNGTITVNGKNAIGVYNSNYTMNHGSLSANGTDNAYAEYDVNEVVTTINNDSLVYSNKICMGPTSSSTITINDGEVNCGESFVYSSDYYQRYRTINIHGGNITAGDYGIYGRGTVVMTSGNMTSNNIGINLVNTGSDVKIYGGKIVSQSKYGIYADDTEDKIKVGISDDSYESNMPIITGYTSGIYALKGTLNIDQSEIIGEREYGVYAGGFANFGIDENNVSIEYPMVRGKINGLYINKGATVNIYDGIYKGTEAATVGFISGFPDAYTFVIDEETIDNVLYETKYLNAQDYFLRVHDKETGTEFNSLQQAIDAIEEEDIIYVVADHVIKTEAEIPEGKKITIDFNGHTLLNSKSITNNGILVLEDETESGGISTSELNPLSKFIVNNNKLIINGGNYMGLTDIVIQNNNDMEMNGGYISNNSSSDATYGIKMNGANALVPKLKMTGGTIDINSSGTYAYGIYTENFQSNVYPYSYLYPEIIIEDGNINVNSTFVSNSYIYRYENGANGIRGGNVTISDLKLNVTNPEQFAKLFINVNNLNISGGEYIVEAPVAIGIDNSNLNMTGGSVKATGTTAGYTIYNEYYSYNTYVGGNSTFEASHTCHVMNGGTTTIDNGTFTCGTYGFTGGFGTFNFNDGILNANGYFGISGSGTLNVRDGEITAKDTAINLTNNSTVDITGGSIVSTEGFGLNSYSSGNNIRIGTVNEFPTTHLPYVYGAKNGVQISTGTLTLGTKDGKVDLNNFTIQGGEYGVNNTSEATINFYDGILKGTEDGRTGSILTIEEGTAIIDPADTETIEVDGEKIKYKLRFLIQTIDIVENERTHVKYNSLQTAIDEAENGDVLDLIANAQIFYPVTISEDKDVTLDHKGYEIVTTKSIVNNGTFVVKDTETNKGHYDTSLRIYLYENHGTLSISDITINNLLTGDVRPVYNDVGATLNLDSVTINSVNNVHNKGVMSSVDSIFNSTNTAITDNGIISIIGGKINATSRGIYSDTNGNGELDGVKIVSDGNPIYKYGGTSTLTVKDSNMLVGQIYNRSGTLKFVNGTIENKIVNNATLIADGTTISDECHEHASYYLDYTSIENSGTMEFNSVDYTLNTSNNGSVTMMNNSGMFKSNNSTYDIEKTNDYKWCPNYWYQPACGGNYGHMIYNTGNIVTNDSNYNFRLTDPKKNHETYMYLIEHRGGKIITDGDTFNMEGGIMSYGIYSTTGSEDNYLKDTTINIDAKVYDDGHTYTKAKTKYGVYQTNGSYLAEDAKINIKDATNAWGIYIDKGSFTMQSGGGIDVSAKTAHGIYIATAEATATVGLKDGDGSENPKKVLTDYPEIKAIGTVTGIGVRKINGSFNFYDGILIGNTYAKPEISTDTESYYEATSYYDEENDYVYCKLEYIRGEYNKEKKTATINNVFYDSVQKAFDKAKAGEIVKLARADIEESPVNNNSNDIILDLHNYTLAGTITNNGYLSIINGQVNGGEAYSLINNNVVRLGDNDENIVYDEVMLISDNTSVQNNGTIYMYDGYIKGLTALVGATVKEPYYAEVVKEDVEETVGDQTVVYETIYLKEYTGTKTDEITTDFDFTGKEETFIAPETGYYLLETWGASGGHSTCNGEAGCGTPGYGAYSRGTVYLEAGETLYINVGGQGGDASLTSCATGGYNGGGTGSNDGGGCDSPYDDEASGGGGGATHIASTSGLLQTLNDSIDKILIVSGGGGGASWTYSAGSGGGYTGGIADGTSQKIVNQTTGYAFGLGENGIGKADSTGVSGGGAGLYGGYSNNVVDKSSGSGGSGYIGNSKLISYNGNEKVMYGYKVSESTEANIKTISTNDYSELPEKEKAKIGNGYAKITYVISYEGVQEGKATEFDYTGAEETFVAPENGYYLLETWGAQGGSTPDYHGGYGAYSSGLVYLHSNQVLYLNVGGQGENGDASVTRNGGYNGGGNVSSSFDQPDNRDVAAGGGATHIATISGLLSSFDGNNEKLLIVAGGGGGAYKHHSGSYGGIGGSAGGFIGNNGTGGTSGNCYGLGGTQFTGGVNSCNSSSGGSFGQGGSLTSNSHGSAGGGGYYGGGGSRGDTMNSGNSSGAGGSGYIANSILVSAYGYEKSMYGFKVTESDIDSTRTLSTDNHSLNPVAKYAKEGNGYAKITQLVVNKEITKQDTFEYKYTGQENEFIAPSDGYYLLETWGAQGGATDGYEAGYGSYSKGAVYLEKGTKLFINVGGQGAQYDGGYNGGGNGGHGNLQWGYGGGGATHIALSSGLLSALNNNVDDIIIVAGGGGGNGGSEPDAVGGAGGGIQGNDGLDISASSTGISYIGTGATNTSAGHNYEKGKNIAVGSFGIGSDYYNDSFGGAGGGGGYYGGGGSTRGYAGAGGGSGYIANDSLISYKEYEKAMYSYKGLSSDNDDTKTYTIYDYSSSPISDKAKAGDGYVKITFLDSGVLEVGTTFEFDYNGTDDVDPSEQVFIVPESGYYKLETWGAQGGCLDEYCDRGNFGGYSTGSIFLNKNELLYIYVGGQGTRYDGGYNGGGQGATSASGQWAHGGGGATHISKKIGELYTLSSDIDSILIVSGGGGGAGGDSINYEPAIGGAGGGFMGKNGYDSYNHSYTMYNGVGASQTTGGYAYMCGTSSTAGFGRGADFCDSGYGGAGGGGGFYGGGGSNRGHGGAGGGSGYIGNMLLNNKKMVMYATDSSYESLDESTKTEITTDYSKDPIDSYAKAGNGYAKITFVSSVSSGIAFDYDYTGGEQTFVAPVTGVYKLQTWGASGAYLSESKRGGYGGYSEGNIILKQGETLYINVGGVGINNGSGNWWLTSAYNGGGYGGSSGGSGTGGGATHIARVSGELKELSAYKGELVSNSYYVSDEIIMVSGGGAGYAVYGCSSSIGGSGGGYRGTPYNGREGTQVSAGVSNGQADGGFGYGGYSSNYSHSTPGAGSGWFGGGTGSNSCTAGGGSGYIANPDLYDKYMSVYSTDENLESDDVETKTVLTNYYSDEAKVGYAKKGAGYARITMVDVKLDSDNSFVNSLAYRVAQNVDVVNSSEIISYVTAMSSDYDSKLYLLDSTKEDKYPIYFWRGTRDTTLNNFIFADYCWLGVRSTDTGGIKIIYNGVPVNGECTAATDSSTLIGSGQFNTGNDNYATDSSSSIIKNAIDSWYQDNLLDYEDYLEDTVFCYDTGDYYNNRKNSVPSLSCSKENSFTVSDKIGNGYLDYPIAPLSADEAMFNGLSNSPSQYNFLYNNQSYWLMTQAVRDWILYRQLSQGYLFGEDNYTSWGGADMSYGYRPVISLSPKVKLSGDGSQTNPYVIVN